MLIRTIVYIFLTGLFILQKPVSVSAQAIVKESITEDKLLFHPIHLNSADQTILPWYSTDLGKSYDFVINATWNFWHTMRTDKNGLPYYMNHQVWRGDFKVHHKFTEHAMDYPWSSYLTCISIKPAVPGCNFI